MNTPTNFSEVWDILEWIANSYQNEQAKVARKALEARHVLDKKYDSLEENTRFLHALEAAGVDNWCGYDEAREILADWNEE